MINNYVINLINNDFFIVLVCFIFLDISFLLFPYLHIINYTICYMYILYMLLSYIIILKINHEVLFLLLCVQNINSFKRNYKNI